jgi:hypothetical protein
MSLLALDALQVIGGITQTPNTAGTAQQQAFAQSIGAISVFPYANGSFGQGISAVAEQSTNTVTAETQAVMNALSAAAADGAPASSPTGGDTALVRSTGLFDLGIIGSVSPLRNPSNILTTECGFFWAQCRLRI